MGSDSEQDDVGYGRPPRHSQFKKGRSGNPNGRPKGVSSIKTVLTAELNETLTVTENGKECTVSKLEAIIKSLTAAAMTDPRAVKTLFALMRQVGVGEEEEQVETVDNVALNFWRATSPKNAKNKKRSNSDSAGGEVPSTQSAKNTRSDGSVLRIG